MTTIIYLCPDCRKKFKMSGFHAVNEVGRKSCEECGDNEDHLHVIGKTEYLRAKGIECFDDGTTLDDYY